MKKIILTAAALLITAGSFALDSESLKVQGDFSSYTKTEYSVTSKFGDYFRTPAAKHVHVYNSTGLETEVSSYNAKEILVDKVNYSYDISRNLISEVYTDANANVTSKIEYTYQADGKLKDSTTYDAAGVLTGKIIMKYTDKESTEAVYDGEGALLGKVICVSDDSGNPLVIYNYCADGSLISKEVRSYLENGKVYQVEGFNANGDLTGKTVYVYDETATLKEIQNYDGKSMIQERIIYKMDNDGNPVKITSYSVGMKFGAIANELQNIVEYVYKK